MPSPAWKRLSWETTALDSSACAVQVIGIGRPRVTNGSGEGENLLTARTDTTSAISVAFPAARVAAKATSPLRSDDLVICGPGHPDRNEFETFIRQGFRRKHGASVHSFMPLLLGLRDAAGDLVGVAGYRAAKAQRLYLEQYLPHSIEHLIATRNPSLGVRRQDVAEIGNFACRDFPTAMDLIGLLTDFLLARQHRWVVFTATRTVRSIMRHLGVTLTELAPAEESRIAMTQDDWGSYYSTDPRVMLGYIPAHSGLSGNLS
jgi:hypothetical protein